MRMRFSRSALGIFLPMLSVIAVTAEAQTPQPWQSLPWITKSATPYKDSPATTNSPAQPAAESPAVQSDVQSPAAESDAQPPVAQVVEKKKTSQSAAQKNELPSVETLNQLKEAKDYDQIVSLLAPLEYDFAGSSIYDRIYGEALLKKGDYDGATLPLERVVNTTPSDVGAHLLLADIYEKQGGVDKVESELQLADKYATSPADKALISQWLRRLIMRAAYGLGRHQLGASVEGRFGWTDNANYGLGFRSYTVPGFDAADQGVDVSEDERKKSDIYYQLTAEGHYKFKFTPRWFTMLTLGGDKLKNRKVGEGTTNYNLLFGKLDAGYLGDSYSVTASANKTAYYLYGRNRRVSINTYGIYGTWLSSDNSQWDFYGQVGQFRYTVNDNYFWTNDYDDDRTTLGGRYNLVFGANQTHYTFLGLNGGKDKAKRNRPDGDSKFYGTEMGYGYGFTNAPWWLRSFYIRGSYGWEKFDNVDQFFLDRRKQKTGSVTTGLAFKPSVQSQWSFIPEISYQDNDTNITYRKYSRWDIGLRIRWAGDMYWK